MLHLEMDLDGIVDPVTPRAFTPGDAMGGMQPHSDRVSGLTLKQVVQS